jgi:hypothetical protein
MTAVREFDTRPWVLCVSVFLSSLFCCSQAVGQESYDPRLPCGLPYECTDGVRFRNAEVRWKLSVNPRRQGVYDIVHWRIAYNGDGRGGPQEFVAQMVFPDREVPYYRIFRHERVRDWRKFWLGRRWVWREFRHGALAHREAASRLRASLRSVVKAPTADGSNTHPRPA